MVPGVTLLLGLVLFVEQVVWAHCEPSPQSSIWAVPGAVISSGSYAAIFCRIPPGTIQLRLTKASTRMQQYDFIPHEAQEVAQFFLPKVTYLDAGIYYCEYWKNGDWLRSSDRLELMVTGVFQDIPTLSAQPSAMVPLRGGVTFYCGLPSIYDTFVLSKGEKLAFLPDSIQKQKNFFIFPVTSAHAGIYRCYGSVNGSRHKWSSSSNLLEVIVTGIYAKPQLSVLIDPSVTSGGNATLQCHSESWYDMFLLSQKGNMNFTRRLKSQFKRGLFRANFTVDLNWKHHVDTYRCYGSQSYTPFLWSEPSEPLTFPVRDPPSLDYTTENCIRLSLAVLLLLALGALLWGAWRSRRDLCEEPREF